MSQDQETPVPALAQTPDVRISRLEREVEFLRERLEFPELQVQPKVVFDE